MSIRQPAIRLLQACVDEADDSYFRFLVEGRNIKYVTIATGIYDISDLCFEPALVPLLPAFPHGDWNEGYISLDSATGKPLFSKFTKRQLPGVEDVWHPTRIDHLELEFGQKLRTGIYEATCSHFKSAVVVKFARFTWEIDYLAKECAAYQWIEEQNIGPRFLGNLTEEGRVIGFIMEKITNMKHATLDDFELCQRTLSKLHSLGITHGDINKYNFLIKDGRAVLIDFDSAVRNQTKAELKREEDSLLSQLSDPSWKGGSHVVSRMIT